jgi:proteasome accessory factor B
VSRKTERLVNLTIALLATKRYITKSEIFRTVEGYEGSAESKERMFERDKDDLRNLGIDIEVGSFDPLFEDEAGYRIKPDSYQFQLGDITSQEVSLLSLAAEAWRGAALDGSALTALRKLHAIGIESDLDSIPELAPHVNTRDKNLQLAIAAINSKRKIAFQYLSESLDSQGRKVAPYAVASKYGHWYLYGHDLDKDALRSFRLDRISSDIQEEGKPDSYEIPSDFQLRSQLIDSEEGSTALIYLRSGRALNLRARAKALQEDKKIDGWDLVELNFRDRERLIEELLWYGDDVVLHSPLDIREEIISRLEIGVSTNV